LRSFHFILSFIIVFFTVFAAACAGNNLPPASSGPTESNAIVTLTPVVTTEASSTVQPTPIHPANTPLPATAIDSGPTCTEIGQTWTSPVDGVTLVCVPAGEFLMGAADNDPLAEDHEKPQHRVYLDAFWIDRTEVTNANFAKCMADGACRPKVYELSAKTYTPYAIHPDYQDYPAFLYEADVAAAYCKWARRRLPTEAEWEKAARGTDARLYPWGNDLDCTKASYYSCGDTPKRDDPTAPQCGNSAHCRTTRVDDYLAGASPYGVLNMAGNVWEWVADWYSPDYYASSPTSNPTGPDKGEFKVRRGGGSKSLSQDLRVTTRASGSPQHYFDDQMGFRCAASVSGP
jgi:formylglycine-generating enzyme required for sulfatase activity